VFTTALSAQQSQFLLMVFERRQPHWLAVTGALLRFNLGNLELEQLQLHWKLVKLTRSTLETFVATTTVLEVALLLLTFWKRAELAGAFLVMHLLIAGVIVHPQSPVEFWYSQTALAKQANELFHKHDEVMLRLVFPQISPEHPVGRQLKVTFLFTLVTVVTFCLVTMVLFLHWHFSVV
jgi:hypothetical protein